MGYCSYADDFKITYTRAESQILVPVMEGDIRDLEKDNVSSKAEVENQTGLHRDIG